MARKRKEVTTVTVEHESYLDMALDQPIPDDAIEYEMEADCGCFSRKATVTARNGKLSLPLEGDEQEIRLRRL